MRYFLIAFLFLSSSSVFTQNNSGISTSLSHFNCHSEVFKNLYDDRKISSKGFEIRIGIAKKKPKNDKVEFNYAIEFRSKLNQAEFDTFSGGASIRTKEVFKRNLLSIAAGIPVTWSFGQKNTRFDLGLDFLFLEAGGGRDIGTRVTSYYVDGPYYRPSDKHEINQKHSVQFLTPLNVAIKVGASRRVTEHLEIYARLEYSYLGTSSYLIREIGNKSVALNVGIFYFYKSGQAKNF